MQKEGHVHLSAKSNTQLTKIAKLRKDADSPIRAKQYIVAELIEKAYKREIKQ